jgi:RluA family pseudouridine synthase
MPTSPKGEWKTQAATSDQLVREGQRFLQCIANYTEPAIAPEIGLIHEDDAIVVINKSAPLPLHPSGRFNLNTLESILHEAYYPEKLRPAHRIDAATTGLTVFSRRHSMAAKLQPQFAAGTIDKSYLAIVNGNPKWDDTTCDLAISSEPLPNGGRRLDPDGQPASTRIRVVERRGQITVVEAIPRTGRTHQIRLHLSSLGHPIMNDPLYSSNECNSGNLRLHAWKIAFDHPRTGQRIRFEAVPPAAWQIENH